jgi:hypothetical protein
MESTREGSIVPNMPNAMGNQQLGNAFSVSRSGQQPQQQQFVPAGLTEPATASAACS